MIMLLLPFWVYVIGTDKNLLLDDGGIVLRGQLKTTLWLKKVEWIKRMPIQTVAK